jgi:nitroreductase
MTENNSSASDSAIRRVRLRAEARIRASSLFRAARGVKRRATLVRNLAYDYRRLAHHTSSVRRGDTEPKLWALITMTYHGLEKGLSLKSPRLGFGAAEVDLLISQMDEYLDLYGPSPKLQPALHALRAYTAHRAGEDGRQAELEREVARLGIALQGTGEDGVALGGTVETTRDEVVAAVAGVDDRFFNQRHSVRHFSDSAVARSDIETAVRRAQKAPAVCNRQSGRVWLLEDRAEVEGALEIQGGARGFAGQVDKVLVVTSDITIFQSAGERNQTWIDGGLFAMALVYALHSRGLGTCCLNWSAEHPKDRAMKDFLGMGQEESIIMLVAVGALPDRMRVAQSTRKPLNEILIIGRRDTERV